MGSILGSTCCEVRPLLLERGFSWRAEHLDTAYRPLSLFSVLYKRGKVAIALLRAPLVASSLQRLCRLLGVGNP